MGQLQCWLPLLYEADVSLKLGKCKLFPETTADHGHLTWFRYAKIGVHTTDAVARYEHPIKQANLDFYSRLIWCVHAVCIKKFSSCCALNKRMRKTQPKMFLSVNQKESAADASLEKELIRLPLLVLWSNNSPYRLDTNACDKPNGRVLLKNQERGIRHRIGYWLRSKQKSRSLTKHTWSAFQLYKQQRFTDLFMLETVSQSGRTTRCFDESITYPKPLGTWHVGNYDWPSVNSTASTPIS